jgi:hypothetical protein
MHTGNSKQTKIYCRKFNMKSPANNGDCPLGEIKFGGPLGEIRFGDDECEPTVTIPRGEI